LAGATAGDWAAAFGFAACKVEASPEGDPAAFALGTAADRNETTVAVDEPGAATPPVLLVDRDSSSATRRSSLSIRSSSNLSRSVSPGESVEAVSLAFAGELSSVALLSDLSDLSGLPASLEAGLGGVSTLPSLGWSVLTCLA